LIQFIGGILVLIGLATRTSAVVCSGSMAYAYFTVHVHHGLFPIENGGELAALFAWSFLMVAILGPGPCPWTRPSAVCAGRTRREYRLQRCKCKRADQGPSQPGSPTRAPTSALPRRRAGIARLGD
jgi:hypothetical protein